MFQQGVLCPDTRTYITKWSIEDCVMFLGRKNIYDTYEFEFKETAGSYYIIFGRRKGISTLDVRTCAGSVYSISFETWRERTKFTVKYDHIEENMYGLDAPLIDYSSLDQFFCQKLDAEKFFPEF